MAEKPSISVRIDAGDYQTIQTAGDRNALDYNDVIGAMVLGWQLLDPDQQQHVIEQRRRAKHARDNRRRMARREVAA